jgi:glutaredoxin
LGGILVALLLVTASALAARVWQRLGQAEPLQPERVPAAAVVEASELAPAAADVAVEPPGPSIAAAEAAPVVAPRAAASSALTAPTPPPVAAPPAQPVTKQPSEAELRAALDATPIVMYGASWCGVCRQARSFFADSGLKYREIDADKAPGGWDEVERLGGRRAVPVIVVDGQVSVGLSPDRIMAAIARSMERRLGVTGIRFQSSRPHAG